MPKLEKCKYSHTETVEAVRDFLHFLTKVYLPADVIVEPPPGGWPSMTPEKVKLLGKSEEVGRLLREIPYVRANNDAYIFPGCEWFNWKYNFETDDFVEEVHGMRICTEVVDHLDDIGSEMIGLISGEWEQMGTMLLDTKRGVVYWCDGPGWIGDHPPLPMVEDDPFEWAPTEEAEWRQSMCWTVRDYFEVLKIQYLQQYVLPLGPFEVERMDMVNPTHHAVMDIFQDHHWPNLEKYDKEKCMAAIEKMLGGKSA